MTDAELQNIFAVNAFGPYYLSRALMRSWLDLPVPVSGGGGGEVDIRKVERNRLKGKQLLFVSSISALVAMNPQHQSAYNASKGAVTMFSKVRRPFKHDLFQKGFIADFRLPHAPSPLSSLGVLPRPPTRVLPANGLTPASRSTRSRPDTSRRT